MTTLIAVVSDVHAGSTVALCPPKVELDDGGSYEASKVQQWLWQEWLSFWDNVRRIRDDQDASLRVVFNGDLVEGNHHGTTQIITGNPTAQSIVWNEAARVPLALKPDKMYFVRGTGSHTGPSSSSEERIADGLHRDGHPVVKCPDTDKFSFWHLRMKVNGRRLTFAHHGRAGQRPWTEQNAVVLLAKDIFMRYSEEDAENGRDEPTYPHLCVRSHFHRHWDSGPTACPTRVIQTPAWQVGTEYVHKKSAETLADIGGIVILVHADGRIEVKDFIRKPRRPTWVA